MVIFFLIAAVYASYYDKALLSHSYYKKQDLYRSKNESELLLLIFFNWLNKNFYSPDGAKLYTKDFLREYKLYFYYY